MCEEAEEMEAWLRGHYSARVQRDREHDGLSRLIWRGGRGWDQKCLFQG